MNAALTIGNQGRRNFLETVLASGLVLGMDPRKAIVAGSFEKTIKVGIIGLSVHSADFTEIINSPEDRSLKNFKVVAIYHPKGNEDVEFTIEQLNNFRERIKNKGVDFVGSIEAVLEKSDAIMLLTNDGRPHLEQVLPVFTSGKPVFIDKPLADTLDQVKAIFDASREHGTAVFSSSALRYGKNIEEIRNGKAVGKVLGADTFSPAPLQPSHVDLFWDGIHGVELLFSVMGTGCQRVTRIHAEGTDVVVGIWEDNRIGVFRGIRKGKSGFGGTVYGIKGIGIYA
jgi:predicted dehydrogenase